ncbi:MAG TPA: phosphoglycerate kinase [Polyangiaceae bacterium]|nr:phosphoglycerate kinase [Polyangiaceae bacterium]
MSEGWTSVNEIASKPNAQPMDSFGTLEDLDCRGRRVLVRVEPHVVEQLDEPVAMPPPPAPMGSEPLAAPAPATPPPATSTLRRLLQLEARLVVATHLTPETRAETGLDGVEALAARLSEQLGVEVLLPDECVGDAAQRVIQDLRQGQLCVLPDLSLVRGEGEQRNDEAFARALASSVDAYVFDAFSVSHLELASTVKLPRLLPRRALGLRCRRELSALSELFASSRGSVGLALGGRSFAEKIDTLTEWLPRVDRLCLGGAMALTVLAAAGRAPAEACSEPERLAQARSLLSRARDLGVKLELPVDFRVQLEGDRGSLIKAPGDLRPKARILDVGPDSITRFCELLGKARHILWWGPLGHLRHPEGSGASRELATLCARPEIESVVLGGDTRAFVRQLPPEIGQGINLLGTGSGAARALLGGRRLPGVEAVRLRR